MLPITRATVELFCRCCLQDVVTFQTKKEEPCHDIPTDADLMKWLSVIIGSLERKQPRRLCHSCYIKVKVLSEFRDRLLCNDQALNELLAESCLEENALRNLRMFCRTCLRKMSELLDMTNLNDDALEVRDWLLECTGIQAGGSEENPELPKHLCGWCYKKLRNYIEFRNISKQSFDYLDSVLGAEEEVVEKNSHSFAIKNDNKLKGSLSDDISTTASNVFAEQLPELSELNDSEYSSYDSDDIKLEIEISDDSDSYDLEHYNDYKAVVKTETLVEHIQSGSEILVQTKHERKPQENLTKVKQKKHIKLEREEKTVNTIDVHGGDDETSDEESQISLNALAQLNNKTNKIENKNPLKDGRRKKTCICEECGKKFRKQEIYEAHIQGAHKNKNVDRPYICKECPNAFRKILQLRRHIKEVHTQFNNLLDSEQTSVAINKCEICSKIFKRKEHLADHISAVHENLKPYKCSYCDKTFARQKTVRIHEMGHTDEKPYTCEHCQRSFRQKAELTIHLERHTTPPELLCPICKRARPSVEELQQHLEQHKESMQHQCPKCGMVFKKSSHLFSHDKAVHLKLRPFKCSFCDKSFAIPRTCRFHERTHTDERPEVCLICQASFKTSSGLHAHLKRHDLYGHEIPTRKPKTKKSTKPKKDLSNVCFAQSVLANIILP